jgi:hypothetical protein
MPSCPTTHQSCLSNGPTSRQQPQPKALLKPSCPATLSKSCLSNGPTRPQPRPQRKCLRILLLHQQVHTAFYSRVYQRDRLGPSLGHSSNVYAYFSFINKFIQRSIVVSIKGTDQPQPRPQRKCLRKLLLHQQVQPTRLRTPHSRVCKRDRLGHSLGPSLNVRACFNRTNSTPASALTLNKNKRLQVEQVQEDKKAPASRRE